MGNTLKLEPPERAKWLERALEAIPKGKVKTQDVFDVITHRKFVFGVPDDLGPKMIRMVKESLMFFSEKQQLNIAKCKLVREFKPSDTSSRRKRRHDEDRRREIPRHRLHQRLPCYHRCRTSLPKSARVWSENTLKRKQSAQKRRTRN